MPVRKTQESIFLLSPFVITPVFITKS